MTEVGQAYRGKVLVTGAGGTVGHLVVPELLKAGWRIKATALARTPLPFQGQDGVEVVRGDMTDLEFVRALPSGCTAVVHCAAIIDITLPWEQLAPLNLDSVRALYEGARAAGVDRFLFLSSASTYAPSPAPLKEDSPQEASSPYEQTKIDAEAYLLQEAKAGGPRLTIVRPSMIFGPRNKDLASILPSLPVLQAEFLPFKIGLAGGPQTNWVHGIDVARAVAFMLDRPETGGGIYNVADDHPKPFGEILDAVFFAMGLRPTFRIPVGGPLRPLVKWLFSQELVLRVLNRVFARGWATVTSRYGLDKSLRPKVFKDIGAYASSDWVFDASRLARLGFRMQYPDCTEGWRDAVRWYQENEWIPVYDGAAKPTAVAAARVRKAA